VIATWILLGTMSLALMWRPCRTSGKMAFHSADKRLATLGYPNRHSHSNYRHIIRHSITRPVIHSNYITHHSTLYYPTRHSHSNYRHIILHSITQPVMSRYKFGFPNLQNLMTRTTLTIKLLRKSIIGSDVGVEKSCRPAKRLYTVAFIGGKISPRARLAPPSVEDDGSRGGSFSIRYLRASSFCAL
jgi:hypothetical protein